MAINPNFSSKALKDYMLVQQAIKGDEKSYTELMERYRESIYYLSLKMVHNKVEAEDLTIEAFTKAFRNLYQYSPNFAFSTWLFRIATNNCIDYLRKKRTNIVSIDGPITEGSEQDTAIPIATELLAPEEELIREQKLMLLRNILEKLKPRYRLLIELRYFKEYSYEEISKELEIPIGTIKAQLFRARELLYSIFKKSEDNI